MLAEEHAALRRLATLVARGAPPEKVFAAAVEEVGRVLAVDLASMGRYEPDRAMTFLTSWGRPGHFVPIGRRLALGGHNLNTIVFETGRSARIDSYDDASGAVSRVVREGGVRAAVGAPIVVEGRLWGMIAAGSSGPEPLPPDTEARLASFTELLATAIANAESRAALTRLAEEQAALRRVATLVARGVQADEMFAAVSDEVGRLVGTDSAAVMKFDDDGPGIVLVGVASKISGAFPLGARWKFEDGMSSAEVYRTGRSARSDAQDWSSVEGPVGETHRQLGIVSAVASPIVVEGRLWGAMAVQSQGQLPLDTEARLEKFTELVATAIANAESRAELALLAGEQAALRRVATLVAKESSPAEVFARVAEEVASVVGNVDCSLVRDEGDGTGSVVAVWGSSATTAFLLARGLPSTATVSSRRCSAKGGHTASRITPRPRAALPERAREIGIRSAVGCPIVVGGRAWGAMAVASYAAEPFPAETESRIAQFSDLVANSAVIP